MARDTQLSEAQIAVPRCEEEYFDSPPGFVAPANAADPAIFERFWEWFVGGKLNACTNWVDRHLESRGDRDAFIWVPEPEDEDTRRISYRELHRRINEFAALLRAMGLQTGDPVRPAGTGSPDSPSRISRGRSLRRSGSRSARSAAEERLDRPGHAPRPAPARSCDA